MKVMQYGILGKHAPELKANAFIDGQGKSMAMPSLKDIQANGGVTVLFCFQAGCPSSRNKGFPLLQQLTQHFAKEITAQQLHFIAVQTAFESRDSNNAAQLVEMQKLYKVNIPFGQDDAHPRPKTMTDYRNGGTPWFIVIDKNNQVIFNDFYLSIEFAQMLIPSAIAGTNEVPKAVEHKVTDNTELQRYEIRLDANNIALVTYKKEGNVLHLDHTEVPSSLRGKGYGAVMMEAALEKIESQGYTINPICSYAKHYSHRYHRWAHLLA